MKKPNEKNGKAMKKTSKGHIERASSKAPSAKYLSQNIRKSSLKAPPKRQRATPQNARKKTFKILTRKKLYRKSNRLEVRPLNLKDFTNWHLSLATLPNAKNEWDESAWNKKFLTRTQFKKQLKQQSEQIKNDQFYALAIFLRGTGQLIGFVSLMDIQRKVFQNAYLGYRIFSPFWGLGLGQEAVRCALDIAFRDLKLHRVEAGISPRNMASKALAKGVGLRYEGLSRKRLLLNGKWQDMELWAMTRELY